MCEPSGSRFSTLAGTGTSTLQLNHANTARDKQAVHGEHPPLPHRAAAQQPCSVLDQQELGCCREPVPRGKGVCRDSEVKGEQSLLHPKLQSSKTRSMGGGQNII